MRHAPPLLRFLLAWLSAAALLGAAHAGAAGLPAAAASDVPGARLAGEGSFHWFGMKIFDAALWIDKKGFNPASPYANSFALVLALPVDGHIINVDFDDLMILMDDQVMLNHAVMRKFAVRLGEVPLSFRRRPQ